MMTIEKLILTWIFSSLLTSYMCILFVKLFGDIKINKKQWISLMLILSLCHTVFRNILPQLFFPFLFILYSSLIFAIVVNVKLVKSLKLIVLFFIFLLITEVIIVILLNIFFNIDVTKITFKIKEYVLSLPVYFIQIYIIYLLRNKFKRKE